MLIVALLYELYRAHECGISEVDSILQIQRERKIVPPVRMLKSAVVRPDEQHDLE